jgi:ubiquinone/menaquinone biosynthesis C-methylase UbiE
MSNQDAYSSAKTVKDYLTHRYFPKAEQAILNKVKEDKAITKMLDIGVGAGRTTNYFAPYFEQYIGVDYSQTMIDVCKKTYAKTDYQFLVCDARNMNSFKDNSFDFILFSFNGIDCVSIEDRNLVLEEVKRICKPSGYFAFSSHNIYNVKKLFSFQMPRNPFKYYQEYKRMTKVRTLNPPIEEIEKVNIISLIDGDIEFSTNYTYIKPEYQVDRLKKMGFTNIETYGHNGKLVSLDAFEKWKNQDAWIYFLCKNEKN